MKTFTLLINLVVVSIGGIIIWFDYQKTVRTESKGFFRKRILILGLIMVGCNGILTVVKHFQSPPPQTVTEDILDTKLDEKFRKFIGEKPQNPTFEEAKSEIEDELKDALKKQEKKSTGSL